MKKIIIFLFITINCYGQIHNHTIEPIYSSDTCAGYFQYKYIGYKSINGQHAWDSVKLGFFNNSESSDESIYSTVENSMSGSDTNYVIGRSCIFFTLPINKGIVKKAKIIFPYTDAYSRVNGVFYDHASFYLTASTARMDAQNSNLLDFTRFDLNVLYTGKITTFEYFKSTDTLFTDDTLGSVKMNSDHVNPIIIDLNQTAVDSINGSNRLFKVGVIDEWDLENTRTFTMTDYNVISSRSFGVGYSRIYLILYYE